MIRPCFSRTVNYILSNHNILLNCTKHVSIRFFNVQPKIFSPKNIDPDKFGDYSGSEYKIDRLKEDREDIQENKRLKLMDRRSPNYYIDIVKTHLNNHEYSKAIALLEERMLKIDRVVPDSFIYDLLISYCGRKGDVKEAFRLYNQIKKRRYHVTGGQYTSLFNACANSKDVKSALEVAQKVRKYFSADQCHKPNIKNYNAMIKAFGRLGDLKSALEVMDEILERRGKVLSDTYSFLLQACISDQSSGFRHALSVWHRLLQNRTDPSTFTFNLILRATRDCGLGAPELLQNLVKTILQEGTSRNVRKLLVEEVNSNYLPTTTENHDKALCHSSTMLNDDTSEGTNNLVCMKKPDDVIINSLQSEERQSLPNLLAIKPDIGSVVDLTLFSTAYHRLMLLGGALGFLRTMDSIKVKPDMKTFTLLLEIIPSTTAAEEDLMNVARLKKIPFDTIFFNMLIKKRCYRFDDNGAKDVLKLMQENRINPDLMTYGTLALCCRKREDAMELIKSVHTAGFRLNSEILGPLVRHATYQEDMKYVRDILDEMREDSVKPSPKLMVLLNDFMKKQQIKLSST